MTAQGANPRYAALSKLTRCKLGYGSPSTTRAPVSLKWQLTNQDGSGADGADAADARYATIPLNFGQNREVTMVSEWALS
jgi:hypothetical protein